MAGVRIRSGLGVLSAALLLASPAVAAGEKAWDEAAVAKLGADLAKACIDLYNEFYAEQGMNPKIGSGDAADAFRVNYKLQRLEEESQGLAGALAAGKGRNATVPRVEEVGMLARDLRVLFARMYVMEPLRQRVDAARAIWVEMLPYYGIAAPAEAPPE